MMRFYPRRYELTCLLLVVLASAACSPAWKKGTCKEVIPAAKAAVHSPCLTNESEIPSEDSVTTLPSQVSTQSHNAVTSSDLLEENEARAYLNQRLRQEPLLDGLSAFEKENMRGTQQVLDEALGFCQASQDFWGQGDFENAIASLDQAYRLILRADTNENSKLIQQKEDIRFMICKRMLEIYTSQQTVVNGNHNAIPMVMNEHIQTEIKRFSGPEKEFFIDGFRRSGRYRDEIVKALKEAGLPQELSWLPLIESGFKINALSRARALGLWQFIPSTGYKFGLNRDQWIDERMDLRKSTQAAIVYLQELHRLFGDWCTVLAAYNCGEARVLRVIRNQNINYLDNFWDLYEKLPQETARYVPRFLAALHILNDPKTFGLDLETPDPPLRHDLVTVSKQLHLNDIAKALNVDSKSLEILNTELRYKVTPPGPYELKVPQGEGTSLLTKLDDIAVYTAPRQSYTYHRVLPGQTLSHLASQYKTTVRAIMEANGLRRQDHISTGERLKIPVGLSGLAYVKGNEMASGADLRPIRHFVKRGDSLWLLARRYNTNIQEILRLNRLESTRLHIGQELLIREGIHEAEPQIGTNTYQVKRGDTPYQIATKHQMSLEKFFSLNNLTPGSKIYPGQVFLVGTK